jgi:hypothetical protein
VILACVEKGNEGGGAGGGEGGRRPAAGCMTINAWEKSLASYLEQTSVSVSSFVTQDKMWKKVAQALGAVNEENENEGPATDGGDRTILEVVSVKGTTDKICSLVGWISISYSINGKVEISQSRRLQPQENCYYDNNNWWVLTGQSAAVASVLIFLRTIIDPKRRTNHDRV